MKRLFLFISVLSVLVSFLIVYAGPGVWTQDVATSSAVWNNGVVFSTSAPNVIIVATNGAGIYKSTNNGVNWVQSNNGLSNLGLQYLAISNSNPSIVATGTTNTVSSPGFYKSTDAGGNWTNMSSGITDSLFIQSIAIDPLNPNNMLISTFTGTSNSIAGIFRTTNGGSSWSASNSGIGNIKNILCFAYNSKNPNVVYCGTSFDFVASTGPSKIYKSGNGGASWSDVSTGLPSASTEINPVRVLSVSTLDTSVVLAGLFMNTTNGGMYLTTNGGNMWTKIQNGLPNTAGTLCRSAIIRPGTNSEFYAGFDAGGMYRTTDRGNSWTPFVGGSLQSTNTIRAVNFRGTSVDSTVFAGVAVGSMGVHEYSYNLVGISNQNQNLPKEFALHQNYPNPFNPTTVITFDLPKDANVAVSIYDVSGRIVKTLMNDYKKAGSYQLNYDASKLSSGIYFYKITAGNFTDTKKMILVK